MGPVHQSQQQIRLDIHICMIRRCYYKHDWLHKHLGTGIHLNLRRLQGKFHIKWKEPYIFCRSKRKGHVASKTAHVLTLRIKQILSHLHVIDISTDNEIWSSSLHQGNRQNRENLLQRMTFKSTLLATVKSNDVYLSVELVDPHVTMFSKEVAPSGKNRKKTNKRPSVF